MTDPAYAEIAAELFAGDWTHRQVGEYVDANKPAILAALELAEQVRALEEWMEDEKYFRWIDIEGVGGVRIVVLKEERTYDEVLRYVERAPTLSAAIAAALGKVTT